MKKLEKMDGKLFESLKSNEMTQLSHLIGGYYTTESHASNGATDTLHHYETWSATNGDTGANKDGLHDDSVKVEPHAGPPLQPIDYQAFMVTESLPEQEVAS